MNPIFKRIVTALSTAAVVVCAIIYADPSWFVPVVAVLTLAAWFEYYQLVARKAVPWSLRGLAILLPGLAIIAGALAVLPYLALNFGNLMLLYVIAVVKISDMGGFALGVAFGRHKLCPSISPNKSWEGLFGSVLASVILSSAFLPMTHFPWLKAVVFGVVAALVGTFGDLVESKFKRWVGVKDSATFMPAGLGGFLDMFDSLMFAPAVLAALMRWWC